MPPLSAILITFNEERDLPTALASLAGVADEIVVVDSGSTDRTCEIARQAGARVIIRAFTNFADQKNFAASLALHDWVLSLDADEALSPELRASIAAWKQRQPEHDAYEIARRTNYLGGWIRHSGWYPEYQVRLYRRDRRRFDGAIHESVRANSDSVEPPAETQDSGNSGRAGQHDEHLPARLSGDLLHYTIRTLNEHYAKQDAFTTKAAEDLFARGRRRWRGAMLVAAPWALVNKFMLQGGFLDGYRGALIAWTSARYVWMKYRKLGVLARGGKLRDRPWPQAGDD
ncbi:MAG TPA: glycosyltransferase family 2 protein [Candidatus Acidoferrales bacterium]|jgi:glycosyltransferase involved in cell wall biosynthesis